MSNSELRNRKTTNKQKSKKTDESSEPIENVEYANDVDHPKLNNNKTVESNVNKSDNLKSETSETKQTVNKNRSIILQKSWTKLNELISFRINIEIDLVTHLLFLLALLTRLYKITQPFNVVFDELHYGKYVSLYMKGIFFFDQHPPLGKQLIAGVAHLVNYKGNFTFTKIGNEYNETVPIGWLRLIPAICGSLLAPCAYKVLLQLKIHRSAAIIGGLLFIFDNALLTQSRFILLDSILLLFALLSLLFLFKMHDSPLHGTQWFTNAILSAAFFGCTISVKYAGIYTCFLGIIISLRYLWKLLPRSDITDTQLIALTIVRFIIFSTIPIAIYLASFYIHLDILYKAGPHDNIMTSAFQSSLEGGLALITNQQPLEVAHGSQITLRHTHGRACWLHSHEAVYPVRYPDKRGSSHQQQVTCYSFKDVNNWWIVKRPERTDLIVEDEPDTIKHGDVVQFVHGITSRGLNSHDVAAPMTPQCQEVTCYIDYNVSMPAQLLWKVHILNRQQEGDTWHAIKSQVRLIHVGTDQVLRFTGRQLPDWGFNQHEVVCDKIHDQQDAVWNVEEHRYTKTDDQKERERQLLNAEMIPTSQRKLSFWQKFVELQTKMFWHTDQIQSHMYSSEPLEWPLMEKGIAYWVAKDSNAQIHLLGNIVIWYSSTLGLVIYFGILTFYLLRRRRQCYDLDTNEWEKFQYVGTVFFTGYLINYVPYFFVERTLFLHHYLPALIFKILLLCYVIEHIHHILSNVLKFKFISHIYKLAVIIWLVRIIVVFIKFSVFSYGATKLTANNVINLRWKDTWDLILHKNLT